jgi:VCBS repeat-containing protein
VWSFTPTGLAQGTQTITASETNAAGLTGSSSLNFTLDTSTPSITAETVSGSAITAGTGVLTAGQTVQLAIALTEAVAVSGGTPSLVLNDGGTATYDAAHSTATSLVFDYTVAAGQYINALAVTGISLNGASLTDVAANAANFAGVNTTFANVSVDATTPFVKGHHAHSLLSSSASIPASSGVLADASDANPSDVLGVSAVDGSSANVGHSVSGSYGTLTMNPDGNYTYTNTNPNAVAALGGVTEDSFTYAVSNGHDGTATSELNVLITSPNETYLTGASGSSIKAGNGSVVLDGSAGNMTLTAGSNGTQWLVGGAGDTLNGGNSADTFLFPPNFGNETINNFNVKHDVIDLPHSEVASFTAVQADLHAVGNSVVLTLDATDSITLTHLQIQSLHAQNFHFF